MTGLLMNMNLWKNLLKHREFDAAVDHVAFAQIMKAKTEPATTRIMRLLDRLSAYSFNLYYVKGRDMILADYLGRNRSKDIDPSELIPISFCCMDVYKGLLNTEIGLEMYNIGTRSSTKASGDKPPEVHGADKPLDPNLKSEHESKSKLPSIVGSGSSPKSPKKILTQKGSPRKSVTNLNNHLKKFQCLTLILSLFIFLIVLTLKHIHQEEYPHPLLGHFLP